MEVPYLNQEATCQNIRKLIAKSGLSYQDIALKTNHCRQTVYKWSSMHVPGIDALIALAYILGCSIEDILITEVPNEK